ncbi:MAG: HEAT repeat domain-containing protein [Kiritimatiellia bacterium]|jgi:HEAT repeat protein|nr:HEAT repeat domain-containing protein [Kiritimatiellia bacterium]
MSKFRFNTILVLTAAMTLGVAAPSFAQEGKLIGVLKSNAGQKEKADACRELARTGTKQAVPVLAALLDDEKLAHMARYAMETIDDPSVDAALREAMGKLKGRLLVGVIGSLGFRKDVQSVDKMAGLLDDADAMVAAAAARALGNMATPDASKALTDALSKATGRQKLAVCEGLLRCAESDLAGKRSKSAAEIYDRILALGDAPHQLRTAALRGAVLSREGSTGLPTLVKALRSKPYVLFAAAARVSKEVPGQAVTETLASELGQLPDDRKALLVQTLGDRGDSAAGPALLKTAKTGPEAARIAAVRALTRLGYAPAVAVLTELAMSAEGNVAAEARKCLGSFPGKEGQAAVLALLTHEDPNSRRMAIELIGRRNMAGATDVLLKAAADRDPEVRAAGLKVLRDVAGPNDLSALIGLLTKAKTPVDVQGAEEALRALCARQSISAGGNVVIHKAVYGDLKGKRVADVTRKVAKMVKAGAVSVEASNKNFGDPAPLTPKRFHMEYSVNGVEQSKTVREGQIISLAARIVPPAFVEAFRAALPAASGEAKAALVRILRSAGGPLALKTVCSAAVGADEKVRDAALRALCDWPTPDAMPHLVELAKTSKNANIKILALRGYIRLVGRQAATPAKIAGSLQVALGLASRDDEKRLVLAAAGKIPASESLALVMPFTGEPKLKEEACMAAVAISEKIAKTNGSQAVEAMKLVAQRTGNKQLAARAKALISRHGRR